jgi:pimeloyl-ACP methyl ester carboxylesterase
VDLRPSSRPPLRPPSRTATLLTDDGVRVSAAYDEPGRDAAPEVAFVVAHGFTGGWRRPDNRAIAHALSAHGAVVSFDHRGHGTSSGATTMGDAEVLDLDAAVRWARLLGPRRVATVGFSMGGSVVLRQRALTASGPASSDAVVSVSAAGFWFYRGTAPMRLLHQAVLTRTGRTVLRHGFGTRVRPLEWQQPYPLNPSESAALIAPTPLLVVHGDSDSYFPVEHQQSLVRHAREGAAERGVLDRTEEWTVPGFAHAESGADAELLDRIGAWGRSAVGEDAAAGPPGPASRRPA